MSETSDVSTLHRLLCSICWASLNVPHAHNDSRNANTKSSTGGAQKSQEMADQNNPFDAKKNKWKISVYQTFAL